MTTTHTNTWTETSKTSEQSSIVRRAARASTVLFAALMAVSGTLYVSQPAFIAEALHPLGYPTYFLRALGAAKILGALALLLPKRPLLREWAYAGFAFDLAAATLSHVATGTVSHLPPALVAAALLGASYLLSQRQAGTMGALS